MQGSYPRSWRFLALSLLTPPGDTNRDTGRAFREGRRSHRAFDVRSGRCMNSPARSDPTSTPSWLSMMPLPGGRIEALRFAAAASCGSSGSGRPRHREGESARARKEKYLQRAEIQVTRPPHERYSKVIFRGVSTVACAGIPRAPGRSRPLSSRPTPLRSRRRRLEESRTCFLALDARQTLSPLRAMLGEGEVSPP
jgi:hypothetical protein